ncbi:MAG TPA: class I tRNA ligase family protein, partial [Candidatus Sulfomarinibacteraceae bacterium]|nr:class I tRNA ligase family protein [Candidatus Sulfomarinibacteraceae bacterium]
PAHDATDLEIGRRHGLAVIDVMADDGTMSAAAGYAGLDRFEARRRLLDDLIARGDLEGERSHELVLGRCQRSDDVVEPRLKTQWFVRTRPLADRALEATRSGRTRIVPDRFVKIWEHWLTEIRDWNVSRQLWWGHRIPAWYCPDGHVTVSELEGGPAACETCARPAAELVQDPDIFDTWFSSGLWPFSTLGWPDATPDLARYHPGSVMETAYDIIFFWVARMVMLGIELTGQTPFETVYLGGLIRDPYGKKMSKTTGNVLDPLEIVETTGADALRFALIHGATPGLDQRFGVAKLENARNFANKLWNATRFVLGARPATVPPDAPRVAPEPANLGPSERWIRSRTAAAIESVDRAVTEFQFAEVTRVLYDAIWSEFCDWGLELAKVRLADGSLPAAEREATWWTLVESLDAYLRLLHPVMPFVTEELWGALPHAAGDPELLVVASWPAAGTREVGVEADVAAIVELVRAIRNARAEAGIEASAKLPVEVAVPSRLAPAFDALTPAIERLARARPLTRHATRDALEASASAGLAVLAGELEARIGSGSGAGPSDADRARLERELAETEAFLAAARARLADERFVARAPAAIVAGARSREAELAEIVDRIRARLAG